MTPTLPRVRRPLGSLLIATVALALSSPGFGRLQEAAAPPAGIGDETMEAIGEAWFTQARAAYEKFLAENGGSMNQELMEQFQERLVPIREAIWQQFTIDLDAATPEELQNLWDTMTPAMQEATKARFAALFAQPDAAGFEAGLSGMNFQIDGLSLAEVLEHPGMEAFIEEKGAFPLVSRFAYMDKALLRPHAATLYLLGWKFTPTAEGMMGAAGYMKMLVDLGALDSEPREALRKSLVAKANEALVAANKSGDADAADRVEKTIARLESRPMQGPIVDQPAPALAFDWVHDANGPVTLASLEDLRGKVVVLDFWATWCGPCVASFPNVRELREHYAPEDVVILGVTSLQGQHYPRGEKPIDCKGDPAKEHALMADYIKAMEITWPVAFSTTEVFNPDYDVSGIPHLAIIDANGVLRHNGLHPAMAFEEKTAILDALLAERPEA
jgi:thiol-disulfide isomerase/thioredoxin